MTLGEIYQVQRDLGVLGDSWLNTSQQCGWVAKIANGLLVWIKSTVASKTGTEIIPLYSTLVGPRLKCCVQFWAPHFKKDSEVPEHTQQNAAMLAKGVKSMSYEEWLRGLGLFSLRMRRLRGTSLKRGGGWSLLPCLHGRTRGNGLKL